MGEACEDCWSCDEYSYWTYFESLRFSQFLRGDFHQRLAIPEYFTRNLKRKLPERVTLKGPSGISWNVDLMTSDNVMFFSRGWKDFVTDHVLEDGDVLIFKLNADLSFDVLMFDGRSLCEKAKSYFVQKCGHEKQTSGCHKEGKVGGSSTEVVIPLPGDVIGDNPLQKSISDDGDAIPFGRPFVPKDVGAIPLAHPFVSQATCKESLKQCQTKRKTPESSNVLDHSPVSGVGSSRKKSINDDFDDIPIGRSIVPQAFLKKSMKERVFSKPRSSRWSMRTRGLSLLEREARSNAGAAITPIVIDVDAPHTSISKKARYSKQYESNRRPVTEEEKKNALWLAEAALTSEGFMVAMKPTHVYKRYFMTIPSVWIKKHLSLEHQDVILRIKDNIWHTKFSYIKARGFGGLDRGWKNFAIDNNLEEFDVCVFERGSDMNDCTLFDVNIFRVVQEVRPLVPV
ncbi:transcriptional factor B3 family protein [Tripterygium wilfordii]|uniref:Transcriptional factor B3 family protein n=1 Tax=Tripterygium wilfordii TaxID=458696 RepID=A0A7J7CZ89_TRIWF|nr:B3 domain-containing protein REM16-like [Tripterygium wilfordii]KAF5739422.1 transcriptional factor B3 family protein [Tripterygium wilfordii]